MRQNYYDSENAPSKKTNANESDYQAEVWNSQAGYPICLPKLISSKKAFINIHCLDNRSFGFLILSYYKHTLKYPSDIETTKNKISLSITWLTLFIQLALLL